MDRTILSSSNSYFFSSRSRGTNDEISGGLGAALSQYSCVNKEGPALHERSSTLMKRKLNGSLFLATSNRATSFNSERRRVASPLLNLQSQQQNISASPKLFSSLIPAPIEPPDILRSDKPRSFVIHRPLPTKISGGREGSGFVDTKITSVSQPLSNSANLLLVRFALHV
jgi:hypothetical protein